MEKNLRNLYVLSAHVGFTHVNNLRYKIQAGCCAS